MPGLIETLQELFGTSCLYDLLGVKAAATDNELKTAYRKRSLQVHPDRVPPESREDATKKFQALSAAYNLLSDKDRRAVYDESGEVDDESDTCLKQDRDWTQYWRLLFHKITPSDIANFEKEYRHSDEELSDLKQAYLDGEGNMEYILDNVLCCSVEDEDRFSCIISEWIDREEVPKFKAFKKLSAKALAARKRKAEKEAREAEEMAEEMGLAKNVDDNTLARAIMKRQEQRGKEAESFLDGLAAKYGVSKKPRRSAKK